MKIKELFFFFLFFFTFVALGERGKENARLHCTSHTCSFDIILLHLPSFNSSFASLSIEITKFSDAETWRAQAAGTPSNGLRSRSCRFLGFSLFSFGTFHVLTFLLFLFSICSPCKRLFLMACRIFFSQRKMSSWRWVLFLEAFFFPHALISHLRCFCAWIWLSICFFIFLVILFVLGVWICWNPPSPFLFFSSKSWNLQRRWCQVHAIIHKWYEMIMYLVVAWIADLDEGGYLLADLNLFLGIQLWGH